MMDMTTSFNNITVRLTTASTTIPALNENSSHIYTYGSSTSEVYTYEDYDEGDSGLCVYGHHGSYFLPVLYSLFFIVGLLGNVLVLWVIFGVKLRSMSDVCLLNLAFADLLLVCSLPFLAHQKRDQWPFGDAMCKMVLGAYYIGFYCGIFFITLMSIDRYLAIVHVFHALKIRTRTFGIIAAAVTWAAGFLASFPDLVFLQVQEAPRSSNDTILFCAPSYTASTVYDTTHNRHFWIIFGLFKMNILGLLIPMTIMVFCYTQIIWTLLHSQSSNKHSIKLIIVVVAVFLCCWLPYNVASFFKALELLHIYIPVGTECDSSKAIRLAFEVTQALAYSHSCLNPILYVFVGEKFRSNLRSLMNRGPFRQLMKTPMHLDRITVSAYSQTPNGEERSATRKGQTLYGVTV